MREKKQLEMYVAQHDEMVQPQERIGPFSNALQTGYIFPWQLPTNGMLNIICSIPIVQINVSTTCFSGDIENE